MLKLLLNANLSPETAQVLRKEFNFDVVCLIEEGKGKLSDKEVADRAKQESRIVVTSDLDFGKIYHFDEQKQLSVIVLRLEDQTVENINAVLIKFFKKIDDLQALQAMLFVVKQNSHRFYKNTKRG